MNSAQEEITPQVGQKEIDTKRIDVNAFWVVRRLRAKGFDAYLTGGCVRDLLLGKTPKDFDVATNAKPEELGQVFRNCRLIGRRFLLAHIFFPGGKIIETSTFRANPTDVQEDLPEDLLVKQDNVYGTIEQDAYRRDLTVNGLFYDPVEGKVIDYVGGREDLNAGVIRTIGDADIRFQEDPVRILRAIKFAVRLDFTIEESTLAAMKKHAGEILRCAPARVQEELMRLLTSKHAEKAFELCRQIGVLQVLMPELVEVLERDPAKTEEQYAFLGKILGALDQISVRDANVLASVAFSALLMPAYLALEVSEQNERSWLDKLCVSWADRIRLTRRDQDRIRLLLPAIRLMSEGDLASDSVNHIVRKSWFREGLMLLLILTVAQGQSFERVEEFKSLAHAAGRLYRQDHHGHRMVQPHFRRRRPMNRQRTNKRQAA